MSNKIYFPVVILLGLMVCFLITESTSAQYPYGWPYPAYPRPVVAGYGYGYAVGYAATPYGYVYNPRRAYRQALRYGYVPLPTVAAVPVYGYPYYGYYPQPLVPTRGPRDYLYNPSYQPQGRPTVIPPAPLPQSRPSVAPEEIPAPSSEPGPR